MSETVVVIGAGPAGMMAAGKAAERGKKVILVEKNRNVGKKLLITGKGRCNITNNTDVEGIINNIAGNGIFLYSSLYSFSNRDIIDFFEKKGLKTKVERGGRVFPVSDKSEDVVKVLYKHCLDNGVRLVTSCSANGLELDNGKVKGVLTGKKKIECDCAVIATGGKSYQATGSNGDGYRLAKEAGHDIIAPKPSLVPLVSGDAFIKELQGLSLRNIEVKFFNSAKNMIYKDFGEMIFTHFGISGPVILSGSRFIGAKGVKNAYVLIDLKPALDMLKLDKRIQRDFEKYSGKQFKNSLGDLLPSGLIPVIVGFSGIDEKKKVNQITRAERLALGKLLKAFKVNIKGTRPINEAIVTAGGVKTDQIDPATMESKKVKGLFFAGEVIDVDGYTGGYNLTIAFSTGFCAGINC